MTIIGITGGSGSGKTTALAELEAMGALIIDCDKVYHELLCDNEDMKAEISAYFPGVLADGAIDRHALAGIVFSDPDALNALNSITHKYVDWAVSRNIDLWKAQGETLAAIDAIALIESGLAKKCDFVIGITAPMETRIKRIVERDNISMKRANLRISAQKPDSFFEENCDYILVNDCENIKDFSEKCKVFFNELLGGNINVQ